MDIPDEILKEIRESGYDQELVYTQIRKLLESDKPIKENEYNLELIDNYLLDKDPQELSNNAFDLLLESSEFIIIIFSNYINYWEYFVDDIIILEDIRLQEKNIRNY